MKFRNLSRFVTRQKINVWINGLRQGYDIILNDDIEVRFIPWCDGYINGMMRQIIKHTYYYLHIMTIYKRGRLVDNYSYQISYSALFADMSRRPLIDMNQHIIFGTPTPKITLVQTTKEKESPIKNYCGIIAVLINQCACDDREQKILDYYTMYGMTNRQYHNKMIKLILPYVKKMNT